MPEPPPPASKPLAEHGLAEHRPAGARRESCERSRARIGRALDEQDNGRDGKSSGNDRESPAPQLSPRERARDGIGGNEEQPGPVARDLTGGGGQPDDRDSLPEADARSSAQAEHDQRGSGRDESDAEPVGRQRSPETDPFPCGLVAEDRPVVARRIPQLGIREQHGRARGENEGGEPRFPAAPLEDEVAGKQRPADQRAPMQVPPQREQRHTQPDAAARRARLGLEQAEQ